MFIDQPTAKFLVSFLPWQADNGNNLKFNLFQDLTYEYMLSKYINSVLN